MAVLNLCIANSARRDIKKLTKQQQQKVIHTIGCLRNHNSLLDIEKLQGYPAYYRVRAGNMRIIYNIQYEHDLIIILVVRDRKDAFKGLDSLDAKLVHALGKVADTILVFSETQGLV